MSGIDRLWQDLRIIDKVLIPELDDELNPDEYRIDTFGAIVKRSEYGKKSEYGWVLDHIVPTSKGGKDIFKNLEILHWKNDQAKADDFPKYNWRVTAQIIDGKLVNVDMDRPRLTMTYEFMKELSSVMPEVEYYY